MKKIYCLVVMLCICVGANAQASKFNALGMLAWHLYNIYHNNADKVNQAAHDLKEKFINGTNDPLRTLDTRYLYKAFYDNYHTNYYTQNLSLTQNPLNESLYNYTLHKYFYFPQHTYSPNTQEQLGLSPSFGDYSGVNWHLISPDFYIPGVNTHFNSPNFYSPETFKIFAELNSVETTGAERDSLIHELSAAVLQTENYTEHYKAEIRSQILKLLPKMQSSEERKTFAQMFPKTNNSENAGTKDAGTINFMEEFKQSEYSNALFNDALNMLKEGKDSLGRKYLNLSRYIAAKPSHSVKPTYLLAYLDGKTSKLDSILATGSKGDRYKIAELYLEGTVVDKDNEKCISILESIPEKKSMELLAQALSSDEDRKAKMYERFDSLGICDSASIEFRAAHYFSNGTMDKALVLYSRADSTGTISPTGEYRLASILENTDAAKAASLYAQAAESGVTDAANRISEMLITGDKVAKDYDKAYSFLTQCNGVSPDLCYVLGKKYMDGKEVTKDYDKAQKLFSIAADAGNKKAVRSIKNCQRHLTKTQS